MNTTLQVNEYPPGVGLSPHIDTHSAFEGLIFSLSLAGPCIMEFRRYPEGVWHKCPSSIEPENSVYDSSYLRRAIYLPPRSMLLLSGEARYAWHHYIPHHKVSSETIWTVPALVWLIYKICKVIHLFMLMTMNWCSSSFSSSLAQWYELTIFWYSSTNDINILRVLKCRRIKR